jgi:hypothetical protein
VVPNRIMPIAAKQLVQRKQVLMLMLVVLPLVVQQAQLPNCWQGRDYGVERSTEGQGLHAGCIQSGPAAKLGRAPL